jgi:hypothetical protein
MSLKQYEAANDGSWGWLSRYYGLVTGKPSAEFTADDWAYLAGYFTQRTNEAIAERDALKAEVERLKVENRLLQKTGRILSDGSTLSYGIHGVRWYGTGRNQTLRLPDPAEDRFTALQIAHKIAEEIIHGIKTAPVESPRGLPVLPPGSSSSEKSDPPTGVPQDHPEAKQTVETPTVEVVELKEKP